MISTAQYDYTSSSQGSLFWLAAVFLAPLLLNLIAYQLPVDVVPYNYLFAGGLILSTYSYNRINDNSVIRFFKLICYVFLIIGFINFFREGAGILMFLAKHYGVIVALGIVFYFERTKSEQVLDIGRRWGNIAIIMFFIQFIYSIYESSVATDFLVNSYDWNTTKFMQDYFPAADLVDRLQINYFFEKLNVPFHITFSGLLGQHNHWGTQLPFYFLLFGYLYFSIPGNAKKYLVCMFLVLIASVFNTSRFCIISIVVSFLVFFFVCSRFSSRTKKIVGILGIAALAISAQQIFETINTYIDATDTFTPRVNTWTVLLDFLFTRGTFSTLFGSTYAQIAVISQKLDWKDYENLGFTFSFERGMPFFFLFLVFLGFIIYRAQLLAPLQKTFARLLVINIILVSLWCNVLMRYSSFGLVAILLCLIFLPTGEGSRSYSRRFEDNNSKTTHHNIVQRVESYDKKNIE
jgi:hypothetical protein